MKEYSSHQMVVQFLGRKSKEHRSRNGKGGREKGENEAKPQHQFLAYPDLSYHGI